MLLQYAAVCTPRLVWLKLWNAASALSVGIASGGTILGMHICCVTELLR